MMPDDRLLAQKAYFWFEVMQGGRIVGDDNALGHMFRFCVEKVGLFDHFNWMTRILDKLFSGIIENRCKMLHRRRRKRE